VEFSRGVRHGGGRLHDSILNRTCKWTFAETSLQSATQNFNFTRMALPTGPVTLSPEQVEELNKKLATMRHDVNNHLSLIVAAVELIKYNPEVAVRMSSTLADQPPKISDQLNQFAREFDRILGILRD
jgi:hypothetical protein